MRVTDKIVQSGMVEDIHRHLKSMTRLQQQLSSGKVVQNLSDDPARAARSVALNASYNDLVEHRQAAQESSTWMNATLGALATARETLQNARTNALQAGNDTQTAETRQVLALAADNMAKQLVQTANTRWNGRTLFGGNKTTTAAFSAAGLYQGDSGRMIRDIGPGETSVVNLTGQEVFVDGENTFQLLSDFKTALNANDGPALRALVPRFDAALSQLLKFEASLGAESKRVDTTLDRLDEMEVRLAERISVNDDTDMPRALVELQNANTLYQAALKASAELFQTSLLDFLR